MDLSTAYIKYMILKQCNGVVILIILYIIIIIIEIYVYYTDNYIQTRHIPICLNLYIYYNINNLT